jgi:uncharacterized protein YdhG (YjbR/CyaY superfamily)
VPGAVRTTGYGMPAHRKGRIFVYFAPFRKHIGLYPPLHGPQDLVEDLAPYRGPNGNLILPHAKPFPEALIARTVVALAAQYGTGGAKR